MTLTLQDEQGFNQVYTPVGTTPLRAARRHAWFASQARAHDAKRVLEIGCGTGEAAAAMAATLSAEVVAVDLSADFVARARAAHQAPNLHYAQLDLLGDDALALGHFDMVYGNGILHHLVLCLDDILRALRSVTNAGGGLAFIEPNFANPYCAFLFGTRIGRRIGRLEPDEMAFTRGELLTSLPRAKWRDVTVDTRDFLLPGLPMALAPSVIALEPALERTRVTRWLAQSHFITASA
jgi:SAM-dependent methyltransferase